MPRLVRSDEAVGEVRVPITAPPTVKGQRTRHRLLAAARLVFAESGYIAARMSDVAERAGVSLGTVYRYFTDKPDVFAALIQGLHEGMYDASRARGIKLSEDPYAALLAANAGFLFHYERNADLMRVLVEASAVDERFRNVWWAMRNRFVQRFVGSVAEQGVPVTVAPEDLHATAEALSFMVEEWAYVWFAHASGKDVEEGARIMTDIWYRALFCDPELRDNRPSDQP